MEFRNVQDAVEVSEVEVLRHTGRALLCRIGTNRASRMVAVPRLQMRLGTTVRHPGDRGRLVIPQSLAAELGLAAPASSMTQ